MKYQNFVNAEWLRQHKKAETFNWHSYENVVFRNCEFGECTWFHSKFYHTRFADCVFDGCVFDECNFSGQHTYLGHAKFSRCTFRACTLKDVATFGVSIFHSSFPQTRFENLSFSNANCELPQTLLQDVDFSQSMFSMTGLDGMDLSSIKLPKRGIRAFVNPDNNFFRALALASGADESITSPTDQLKKCPRRALLVLGAFKNAGIDPIVHSEDFLDSMLRNPDERKLFEEIASRFEINRGA
jgi:uncharacterized protein YjbI with pentapeptide repeats